MSACKGETADLDLTGTLPLNFLPWIKFLKRHFGFCWLPWWFFPPWRANIERQIPSGVPAPLRGEVMRSTPQFLQLHLQDKPKAVFCLTAFGTSIIQCPCQPAACLGGLLTNTAYLKHLFFFSLRPVLPAPILVLRLTPLPLLGAVLQHWSFWVCSHTWV